MLDGEYSQKEREREKKRDRERDPVKQSTYKRTWYCAFVNDERFRERREQFVAERDEKTRQCQEERTQASRHAPPKPVPARHARLTLSRPAGGAQAEKQRLARNEAISPLINDRRPPAPRRASVASAHRARGGRL